MAVCRRGAMHISIHALREESDMVCIICSSFSCKISIHALREESDR